MEILRHETEVLVRFSEVDSLLIVWHGHYVRYFEDAREAFGLKYGIHYLDVHRAGYSTPIVKVCRNMICHNTNAQTILIKF